MRLSLAQLDRLPPGVARPAYHPARHGVGVVHLGVGVFHRAHQAPYLDEVLAREGGDWRILGVSLRSAGVHAQLAPQDGLYTLIESDDAHERRRVVGAVAGVLVAPHDADAVLAALARPATRVVSLTVTEKGYCHDPATGRLNPAHPDIIHDLAHPATPRSAPGHLVEGLARRRAAGAPALTLLCCDNLPDNGRLLAGVLVDLASRRDAALADWIAARVACPSTMVDRIAPATMPADVASLEAELGLRDEAMVRTEAFSQWVVEDRFSGPRPDLAAVGVQLVADVRPFELAKLRMLNGAHSTLAYLGVLAGHTYVHEAIAQPDFAALIRHLMLAEAAPTLPSVAGLNPAAYADALMLRFTNPALRHRLRQIATDGSQKLPQRLLGVIRDSLAAGRPFEVAALGVAAWIRYAMSRDENGAPYAAADPLADQLADLTKTDDPDALAAGFLGLSQVFGDIGRAEPMRVAVTRHLRDLLVQGAPRAVSGLAAQLGCGGSDPSARAIAWRNC